MSPSRCVARVGTGQFVLSLVTVFLERLREFAEVARAGGLRLGETLTVLRDHRL